jgi:peptidoglycan/xylan/chitin deacetylase (PgdA/CDA1 family)
VSGADARVRLGSGAWFESSWRMRTLRRAGRLPGVRLAIGALARLSARWREAAADIADWAEIRALVDAESWRRHTASSYVALVYHRFAGELKPGQERIDVLPRRFARQLRALRLLSFRPLAAETILAFHAGEIATLPRRGMAITVDDAIADCVEPLRRHATWHPQLFVPTAEVGASAYWIDGEPVASWKEITVLANAGIAIGSHTRHHRRLTELDQEERASEIAGSLADLRERLPSPLAILAYPNGDHDDSVCRETRAAGYAAAFTTEKGRNGAGTDRYRLRRVSVHGADGALAVLWKAATGEGLPGWWLRLRRFVHRD